jgi:hypothetical protein
LTISDVKGHKRRNIKFHANMNLSRNYFEEFKSMCKNIELLDLRTPTDIELSYKYATQNKGVYILVEYPELYYKN